MSLEQDSLRLEKKLGYYFGRLLSQPLIPPEHAYFSLTNRCNLKCIMCDIPSKACRQEEELSTSKVKDIVLQIKDMGINHLIFSGGEPLLREDLVELVEFSTANNIEMVDIITNGVLFRDAVIKELIKARLSHITVSLDGLAKTNDRIRGRAVFEKAQENIDRLNHYKSKMHSPSPSLGINFTVMEANINDMLAMVDFARSKKCNIIVFQPVLFSNTNMRENRKSILWPSSRIITSSETSLPRS